MHINSNIKRLSFIDFATLDKWYVSYYINPFSIKSNYKLAKLKSLINPVKEKIKLKDYSGELKVVKKVSFGDGKIHLREVNETKMDLYVLHPNDLLVSKINFHQGAVAINKFEKIVCTTHYQPYSINREAAIDEYLVLVLRNKHFQNHLEFLRAEGIKNEATYEFISELEIPLPSLAEQEKIINEYNSKIIEAEELQRKAIKIDKESEDFLFSILEIQKKQLYSKNRNLNVISFSSLEKWGVEFNLGTKSTKILDSKKYENIPLKKLVEINPKTILPKEDIIISFIPMECISDKYSEIIELREKRISESKGYTKFQEGDLIWARITPCMQNGKSAIVSRLKNNFGCGSTEFHVIRNSNPKIDIHYVYHILRLNPILEHAMSHFTGSAGQQRVPKEFLENLSIPVPPFSLQVKISKKLSELKSMKKDLEFQANEIFIQAEQDFEKIIFS